MKVKTEAVREVTKSEEITIIDLVYAMREQ